MAARRKAADKPAYKILSIDPYLKDFAGDIDLRMQRYSATRKTLLGDRADISSLANGYLYYGFHRTQEGWVYREWAPGADEMHLIGDFNQWDRLSHPMERLEGGAWEIRLKGSDALRHGQRVKVQVTRQGQSFDRIPLYIRYVTQEPDNTFVGRVWAGAPFRWSDAGFNRRNVKPLFIYEAHVGMAQEKDGVGTYREFADNVLPRVKAQGYNAVQLMAIAQHPYYGSFGYQVSNFFAPSSWFGTPDDLKYLVDKAHGMGLSVLMDLVHSHAAPNAGEGINLFDGTEDQFFHAGPEGWHPAWGTRLFNYGKHEVIHFLLSNIKYWLMEYHFDGFRFDGVTSMLYHDHGLGKAFVGYETYFSLNTDVEAVTYLQLANELIHTVNPFAVTIAEDMSGMPGMALPIRWGGVGFDYRLSMGVPDLWVKALDKERDEDWDMGHIWYELTTCRPQEKTVGYCECHDQALVGDKTIIFRMADAEMYTGMDKIYHSPGIDRAIALDNMIRFITLTLAGEGWLNFMGNEFGHPEWIDFPREGNGWSFHYARRQWSLADNGYLKFGQLRQFDHDMLRYARKRRLLADRNAVSLWIDQEAKVLAYAKRETVLLFNFHPTDNAEGFFVPVGAVGAGTYTLEFDTDRAEYGGWSRFENGRAYQSRWVEGRGEGFYIDLPRRAACALTRVKEKA